MLNIVYLLHCQCKYKGFLYIFAAIRRLKRTKDMRERKLDSLRINKGKLEASLSIVVHFDKEDKIWYGEVPSLNIASFGDNKQEAEKMVLEALSIHLEYMLENNTLQHQLEHLGWNNNPLVEENYVNQTKHKRTYLRPNYSVYNQALETAEA